MNQTAPRPPANMPPPPPGTGLTQQPLPPKAPPAARQPASAPAQGVADHPTATAASPTAQAPSAATRKPAAATEASSADRHILGGLLLKGVIFGPVAIGAQMLLLMWASAQAGDEAVRPLRALVAVIDGGAALVAGSPVVGTIVNVVLGAVLGVLFALMARAANGARNVVLLGLAFAAGVFAVDYYLLAPLISSTFELRDPAMALASRLVFGAVLAAAFLPGARD